MHKAHFSEAQGHVGHSVVHDHLAIGVILEGEMNVWCGANYQLQTGSVFVVKPGAAHHASRVDNVCGFSLAVCGPCWARENQPLAELLAELDGDNCPVRQLEPELLDKIVNYLELLHEELRQELRMNQVAARSLLELILVEILRAKPQVQGERLQKVSHLVEETIKYIEMHALEDISLKDVAQAVGRSAAHLTTVIKQHTGATVQEWITGQRMTEARRLLLHSDELVEVVAERVGYSSVSHFHRLFRKAHSVSPAQWRKMHL